MIKKPTKRKIANSNQNDESTITEFERKLLSQNADKIANDYEKDSFFDPDQMPFIVGENDPISNLADVISASGLFGNISPAKVAVQLLAGRELGFSPIRSMTDLKFENGRFEWTNKPFQKLQDEKEIIEQSQNGLCPERGELNNSMEKPSERMETLNLPKAAQPIIEEKPKGLCPECGETLPFIGDDAHYYENEKSICSKSKNEKLEAGKSNLRQFLIKRDEKNQADLTMEQKVKQMAAEKVKLETVKPGDEMAQIMNESPAVSSKEIANSYDDLIPENVQPWRYLIETLLLDLGLDVKAKTEKFDSIIDLESKRKLKDSIVKYHSEQLEKMKTAVTQRLKKANFHLGSIDRTDLLSRIFVTTKEENWTYKDCERIRDEMQSKNLW